MIFPILLFLLQHRYRHYYYCDSMFSYSVFILLQEGTEGPRSTVQHSEDHPPTCEGEGQLHSHEHASCVPIQRQHPSEAGSSEGMPPMNWDTATEYLSTHTQLFSNKTGLHVLESPERLAFHGACEENRGTWVLSSDSLPNGYVLYAHDRTCSPGSKVEHN